MSETAPELESPTALEPEIPVEPEVAEARRTGAGISVEFGDGPPNIHPYPGASHELDAEGNLTVTLADGSSVNWPAGTFNQVLDGVPEA